MESRKQSKAIVVNFRQWGIYKEEKFPPHTDGCSPTVGPQTNWGILYYFVSLITLASLPLFLTLWSMVENLDSLSLMWETLKPEVGDREPRHSTGGGGRRQWSGLKIFEHGSKYFFELTLEGKEK